MEGLKRTIDETELNAEQIRELESVLFLKKSKLGDDERLRELEELRAGKYDLPSKFFESVQAYLRICVQNEWLEEPWQKAIEDDDFLCDCARECKNPIKSSRMFVEIKEDDVRCFPAGECWYLDMNPDRIEEHQYNYYHAGTKFPKRVYCDVCINNLEDDEEEELVEEEMPWIVKALREELKKKGI